MFVAESRSDTDTAAFIDRSNIGNAQTAGMGEDLGYDDAQYQVSSICARRMENGDGCST